MGRTVKMMRHNGGRCKFSRRSVLGVGRLLIMVMLFGHSRFG